MGRPKSELIVKITKHGDRPYAMYWDNPLTGKREWRSTGKQKRDDALAIAAVWAADIREQRYKPDCNITWEDFRELFLEEHLADCTRNGRDAYVTALNKLEKCIKVGRLAELSADRLQHAVSVWRKDGLAAESIRTYLRHIRAALSWAVRRELLRAVPNVTVPKRKKGAKKMKGRPITGEEYDRLLDKIVAGLVAANVCEGTPQSRRDRLERKAKEVAPAWRRFMDAMYWGGLRLTEALTLSWDDERFITVDMSGPHPRLRIQEGQDKSQTGRLLPLAPQLAAILTAIPPTERHGTVFKLPGLLRGTVGSGVYSSKVIACIGRAAGVKTDSTPDGKVKFASAHDFRRSFGTRWATRVMPATLQRMMRHASINTTMNYYVDLDAKSVEDEIYGAASKVGSFVDNGQKEAPENAR